MQVKCQNNASQSGVSDDKGCKAENEEFPDDIEDPDANLVDEDGKPISANGASIK